MLNSKYVLGLILITFVVWLTMILCLVVVYSLLPSMEFSSTGYIVELLEAVLKLLVAGFVLLVWLYSWNMLVKLYFKRNLNQTAVKQEGQRARKKNENMKVNHVPRKSTP
jgi:hypothetical protein